MFRLWFRVKPGYGLLVEAGWLKTPAKRRDSLSGLEKDMKFHHWDDSWRKGYGIPNELIPELEGNADLIKDWFVRVARLALNHHKVN